MRHQYGDGPFARLLMPDLPDNPGLYIWELDGDALYLGQTSLSLARRLGPQGYSVIHQANTLAPEPGRRNGGQQTNCRINALANKVLRRGGVINLWTRETAPNEARDLESRWMAEFGTPPWNRRSEEEAPRPRRQQAPGHQSQAVAPQEGADDSDFWTYENFVHQYAKVHRAWCSHCRDGRGTHSATLSRAGQWLGPFADRHEAAKASDFDTSACHFCSAE